MHCLVVIRLLIVNYYIDIVCEVVINCCFCGGYLCYGIELFFGFEFMKWYL